VKKTAKDFPDGIEKPGPPFVMDAEGRRFYEMECPMCHTRGAISAPCIDFMVLAATADDYFAFPLCASCFTRVRVDQGQRIQDLERRVHELENELDRAYLEKDHASSKRP
jgi:hypothetical protein